MVLDLRFKKKISEDYIDLFNKVSTDSIDDFYDFFNKISKNQPLDWWLSSPASRYNLSSPLFHNFCSINLVKILIKENRIPNLIIVDSKAVKVELTKYFNNNNIKIKIIIYNYYLNFFKLRIKNIIIFLHQLFYRVVQLLIFNFFIKIKKISNLKNIIIIDKYIFPKYIDKERYYNGLKENISQNQINQIYFIPTLAMIQITDLYKTYKKLLFSEEKYIFKENYYTFSSIIYSLFHYFRKRNIKIKDAIFNEINFCNIIKEELSNDTIAFFAGVESFLTIHFIKNLKKTNISIYKVIDWFENQTIDKAWNYGFNKYFPDVSSLGYKGMAPSQMLQSEMYTLEVERNNFFLPKKIGVIGRGFIEEAKRFNRNTPVIVCPAFRFDYLWKKRSKFKRKKEKLKILFALPITVDQSIRILSKLIDFENSNNYEILIKPHPTTKDEIYINYLDSIKFRNFSVTNLSTNLILPDIDFFVGGMSSISLEAICLGKKVIIVNNELGINYFTIPKKIDKNLYLILKLTNNLFSLIKSYKTPIENVNKNKIFEIKKEFFEPINDESMKNFFN